MSERTVFVSYSRKDSDSVQHAVSLLEAGGAQVFRDLDDIQFGDRWETVIREKLAEAERVLVFWSEHAKASEWVTKEWEIAVDLGKRLVPVLLDETPMPAALGQFHALTNFMPETKPEPVKALNSKVKYTVLGVGALSVAVMAAVLFVPVSHQPNDAQVAQPNEVIPPVAKAPSTEPGATKPLAPVPKPAASPLRPLPGEEPSAPMTAVEEPPPAETAVTGAAATAVGDDALTMKERQQLGGFAIGTILVGLAILMYWFKRRRQRVAKAAAPTATAYNHSPDEFIDQVFTEYK